MKKGFFTGPPAAKGETAPFATWSREDLTKLCKSLEEQDIRTTLDAAEYYSFVIHYDVDRVLPL
jgi:hypothetical protein